MELLIMTQFNVDDDVQDHYREIKDHYYQMYPADTCKNTEEEFIEQTAKDRATIMKKINKDLVEPTIDILDDMKEELNLALLMIYDLGPISSR